MEFLTPKMEDLICCEPDACSCYCFVGEKQEHDTAVCWCGRMEYLPAAMEFLILAELHRKMYQFATEFLTVLN